MPLQPPLPRSTELCSTRLPGRSKWHATVARTWTVLAALALAAGALWRLQHSAPPLQLVLDAAGLALALSAMWLAPALEQLLMASRQHQSGWLPNPRFIPSLALAVAGAGLTLATAPLGLLLAYDAAAIVTKGSINDGAVHAVPIWGMLALVLLLLGPGLVMLAASSLAVLRAIFKPGLAAVVWLALLLACHASLAGAAWWAGQPVTLGAMLQWLGQLFERAANDPAQSLYITELLGAMAAPTLLELCAALLALALALLVVRRALPPLPAWIIPALAVTAAFARAAIQTQSWTHDMSRRDPGAWFGVLASGLLALLAGHWLLVWDEQPPAGWRKLLSELAWSWCALAACAVCTAPYIWAGPVQHADVLWGLLGALASASPVIILLRRIGPASRVQPLLRATLLTVLLLLLVLPVTAAGGTVLTTLGRTVASAMQQPEQAQAGWRLLGCLAGLCLALWPWPRRAAPGSSPAPVNDATQA
jgi:hypothetical protein